MDSWRNRNSTATLLNFRKQGTRTHTLTQELFIISSTDALHSVPIKLSRKKMFKVQTLHPKLLEKVMLHYLLGMASMLKLIMLKIFFEYYLCWIATEKLLNCLLRINSRIPRLVLHEERYVKHHRWSEAQGWLVSISSFNNKQKLVSSQCC